MTRKKWFLKGMRAGIPISLGYFAVAIAIGIAARQAGLSYFQEALTSLLINASAGEYVGFDMIKAASPLLVLALMEAVANARYLLMSAALSQKLRPGVGTLQRLLLGFTVTDEIFGVSISLNEPLDPFFTYGTFCVATAGWTSCTFVGALLGNILHISVLIALGVGLFGMFISIFVPEARKNKVVAVLVLISFALSAAFHYLPYLKNINSGITTIVLTVVISLGAAILFPIKDKNSEKEDDAA